MTMGRQPRIEYAGASYYVTARTSHSLIEHRADTDLFLEFLGDMADRFSVRIMAYCLIPSQYHLLVQTPQPNLSRAFQWFATAFTRRCNTLNNQTGKWFSGRFHSVLIENEKFFESLIHRIHALPVWQGISRSPYNYKWSSCRAYIDGKPRPPWLDLFPVVRGRGKKDRSYKEALADFLKAGQDPLDQLKHGAYLGSEQWVDSLQHRVEPEPEPGGDAAVDRMIDRIASHFDLARDQLVSRSRRRSEEKDLRDLLILHLYDSGLHSGEAISRVFNITPSAASHLIRKIKVRLVEDRELQDLQQQLSQALVDTEKGNASPTSLGDPGYTMEQHISGLDFSSPNDAARTPRQAEKSLQMRRQLILATLYCLDRYGYHGASLSRILKRAGVSRGAWRYHYRNKRALVAAAAQAMYQGTARRVEMFADRILDSNDPINALFDFIWQSFHQGWHRNVWLEFTVASRTDHELRTLLEPVIERFFNTLDDIARKYFQPESAGAPEPEKLLNLSLYVSRGMAIQSIVYADPEHYDTLREVWGNLVSPLLRLSK